MATLEGLVDEGISNIPVVGSFWDAGKFFANLIGIQPRGDLQKFARVMYPVMAEKAAAEGFAVYDAWWGDVVRVGPQGQTANLGPFAAGYDAANNVFPAFEARISQILETEKTVFVVRCFANADRNSPEDVRKNCWFQKLSKPGLVEQFTDFFDIFAGTGEEPPLSGSSDVPVLKAGIGGGGLTPIFLIVAVVGLLFILPKLGD